MKNIKKLVATALIGAFAITGIGCNMIEKTPEAIKKSAVAKVNDETITRGQLDDKMAPIINQMKAQPGFNENDEQVKEALKQQRKEMVDKMVDEVLLLQKAKELKVVPSDKDLNDEATKKYDEIKKQYNDDKKFADALSKAGYTEASLKNDMKNQIIISKVVDSITKDAKVTDEKAKEYYTANQLQFTEKPAKIELAHILVEKEDEANAVKARLDKGEDFAKVAKEVSKDPGSKDKGGDLGKIDQGTQEFDKTFMATALTLKKDEVSKPVKTQFGFHIIKCKSREDYPVKSFDAVKEDIKTQLLNQEKGTVYQAKLKEWKEKAKIKINEKNM